MLKRLPWRPPAWAVILLALGVVGSIGVGVYSSILERRVMRKWEGRKWDVPSKVLSDAFLLYPGKPLNAHDFTARLERLGYLEQAATVDQPGEFAQAGDQWLIYLHAFEYPDGPVAATPIRVSTRAGVVDHVRHAETGDPIDSAALEPEVIGVVFDQQMEDRTPIDLDDVPRHVVEAILAVEDARFYRHPGIDPIRVAGATLANLRARRTVQGGSTITQQLVKNYYLTAERTYERKLKEAGMALILEARYPKEEILEAYLNEIYLGQRGASSIMGVEQASRFYFGKSVREIDLVQAATLAGLIRDPGRYNPHRNPERAQRRRDLVLHLMHDQGRLTDEQLATALAEPLDVRDEDRRFNDAPYFVDFVLAELADRLPREQLEREGLRIFTTLDMGYQIAAERSVIEGLERLERDYAHLQRRAGDLESALVAIDPQTGFIRAMVGGRDYARSQFNRAHQASRQPGSTFKPFVYLTAFRTPDRWSPATTIDDVPFEVVSGDDVWAPTNDDDTFHGNVSLRMALTNSMNLATARLALDVGLGQVTRTARAVGITSRIQAVPSVALGAFEVTPLELASAYATLANGGIRTRPLSILAAIDEKGQVLQNREIHMDRVVPADAVYMVNHTLTEVFDSGTARRARALGYHGKAAGKTGTTNSTRDTWFVGYTPELVALVWVGYDDNAEIGLYGGRAALPIWVDFMRHSGVGDRSPEFSAPRNIVTVEVDPETGELATPECRETRLEIFVEGTEPRDRCHIHGGGWWIF